jgi:hypothetical protein
MLRLVNRRRLRCRFRRGPSVRKSGPDSVPRTRSQALMASWVVSWKAEHLFLGPALPGHPQRPSVQFQVRHVEPDDLGDPQSQVEHHPQHGDVAHGVAVPRCSSQPQLSATVATPGPRVSLNVSWGSVLDLDGPRHDTEQCASIVRGRMAVKRRLMVAGARCRATSALR